jgi:hypothetical protein
MASTRPAWALNLPSGPSWYEKWWDFDSELDLADFAWTIIGGDGTEQCAWKGSIVISDEAFGSVVLTTDDHDNDSIIGQAKYETLKLALGKTYYIVGRLKGGDATQQDDLFGAWKRDTVPLGGSDGFSDGAAFRKDDGDTNWDAIRAYNASTFPDDYAQENGIYTEVADTYKVLTIKIVMDANTAGVGTIQYYVDGVDKHRAGPSAVIVHDEELAIGFGVMAGEAAAKTLTIDGVGILAER